MKFEFCSRFRNRNEDSTCGDYNVESAQRANDRFNALDPVCDAAPLYSWQAGFSATGTINASSAVDTQSTELIIVFGSLALIATTPNFLTGCIVSSTTFNVRISESYAISALVLRVTVPQNVTFTVGMAVTVADYTTFSPLNIRAPTTFDMGQCALLYNERLNTSIPILACDMTTRRLTFAPSANTTSWLLTDQLNIRNANPSYVTTILAATLTTLTLNVQLTQTHDWVRLRLSNYNTQAASASWSRQIVNISGATITLFPPLPTVPSVGSTVEILPFSYDNAYPMENYEIPKASYFNVTLESLIVPNVRLANGDLTTISHLIVELRNETAIQSYRHFINSNNVYVQESVWIAKLDAQTLRNKDLRFVVCDTNQKAQAMELNIMKPFQIILRMPNGKIFQPILSDNYMPQATWQDLNYVATFEVTPVK